MSDIIASLRVALGLDSAQFVSGAAKARREAKTTATSIQASFNGVKSAISTTLGAFGVALSVGAIVAAGKAALEYAGHLGELADTLGLTTKDLQTFSYAAGQVGISQDELQVGIQKLTISMGQAQLGAEKQVKAFNAIGISVDDLKGKSAGDVFRLIAERLETVSDRSQRAAIEVALFGKAGAKLDNLLSGSQGRLNDLSDAAERLGIVLSDEQIRKADETADKIAALQTVLKTQIAGQVADNADSILMLANALAKLLGTIGPALKGWRTMIAELRAGAQYLPLLVNPATAPLGVQLYDKAANRAAKDQQLHDLMSSGLARFRSDFAPPKPKATQTGNIGQFLAPSGGKPKKDHSAEDAERKRLEALRQANDVLQEQIRADIDILQAKKDLSTDTAEQTSIENSILDKQREAYKAQLDFEVATKDKTKAQADNLLALYDEADHLKRQKILNDEQEQRQKDAAMLEEHDFDRKRELLEKQADLATTQSERRQIELDILKLAYEEKKQALQRIIDNSKDQAAIEDARRDLANLNQNYSLDRQGVMQRTQGPLENYLQGIPHTADQVNEALQNLEVQGIDGLAEALSHVGEGWKAMRDIALRTIQDIVSALIKMQVEKMIFSLLGQAASGLGGGGFGGTIASNSAALSSASSTALASIPADGGFATGSIPGFATGGSFNIMGRGGVDKNMLSLNGLPIARVSHGERVSIGNDNQRIGGSPVHIHVNGAMSDSAARRTGMQVAAGYQSEMARARTKGIS